MIDISILLVNSLPPAIALESPSDQMEALLQSADTIGTWVDEAMRATAVYDLHTHLYPANFGPLVLWGIDELLTYHYLIGETIRATALPYERFWAMSQSQQADFIWRTLFVERAPISEACRGVITVLNRLGLDPNAKNLGAYRAYFRGITPGDYIDTVFRQANAKTVVMTNDPLDRTEREIWLKNPERDPRFKAVLRIDPLLLGWPGVADTLGAIGYKASADLGASSLAEIPRFLTEWIDRIGALYVAVSLPPSWRYPQNDATTKVLNEAILPVCRERNLPFAMMIGVTRQANPLLRLAGDSLSMVDISSLERVCAAHPKNKFMCTVLARENQHALAVAGRLFPNLFVFGCWWYVNNPSLVEEITRMRMELLGPSFTPQHSDCRVLDQLIYKWDHSRQIIGKVLKDKFADVAASGWNVTREQVDGTVRGYLAENFERFLARNA